MLQRCFNPNSPWYHRYGGRGVTCPDSWRRFEGFLNDMGVRPVGKTLDRLDNDKPYSKENCAWRSRRDQANNRSSNVVIEWEGQRMTLAQWADHLGVPRTTLGSRRRRGEVPPTLFRVLNTRKKAD